MNQSSLYANAQVVNDPTTCQFYHRMTIPGHGEVGNQWDLQEAIGPYLGDFDFKDLRVLDVGAAAGYLTFEIERRGAKEVVSFDMADGSQWDVVPQSAIRKDPAAYREANQRDHQRLKNAYWFAHARLESKAKVLYGNIYDIPDAAGPFDVAVMGMIVGHLRDPLHAMANVAKLCRSHLIIANQYLVSDAPRAFLIPSKENKEWNCWWALSSNVLEQMLGILGFEVERIVRSRPRCIVNGRDGYEDCMTLVARRVD